MEEIIKFKAIPIYEKYYSEDTNWGCYNFTTEDILPRYQISEDISGNKINIGVLAGKMQQLHIGTEYEISATLEFNKKYKNYQYKPIVVSAIRPKNVEDQKKFIKSILTTNQANTLIELYPNIVNDVINGKCDIDLNKTKGIKEYTWNLIKNKIIDNYVISDILIMLQPLGVTYTMIKKLLNNEPNPELLKQKLNDNPYILTEIHGLGFKRVDDLALKLNPDLKVSNKRTYAFLNYYLREIGESNGHTWVTFDFLENAVRDNIIECEELYYKILDVERDTQALLYIDDEKNRIGLKYYRDIEIAIYDILKELDSYKSDWDLDVEKGIQQAEKEQGFEFSNEQKEVIREAVKHNVTGISGRAGCVDCDTEYFNGIEWIKISKYKNKDKVLQYNKDGSAELVTPLEYHKYPAEYLWHFETKYGLDQCLSDEHNVYYITSKNNLYHKTFKEVRENHNTTGFRGRFITTFDYNKGKGLPYNEWEIRLKVAIKADGSFKHKNKNRPFDCFMNVKKQRKKDRIEYLLKKNNINYEILNGAEGYNVYKFTYLDTEKTYTDKWYNCTKEQFGIIFDEIFYWDGDYKNKDEYYTTIKSDADFIQFVGTTLGYRATIQTQNRLKQKYKTSGKEYIRKSIEYQVIFSKRILIGLCIDKREDHTKTPIKSYKTLDGYKYCFTVPSEMLVLRRNDKIFITGNSGKTTISRALLTIYKNANKTIGAAALSAKAAQRITEATSFQASTIHRLLGAKGLNEFTYNYENPLPYDVILADECSMNNARIFYDLISAIKTGSRLIMSGDCQQLPPIGFGNIFSDILELKEQFNIYELTKVHRQAEKSGILTDANLIREGINPIQQPEFKIIRGELQDMYYMFRDNKQALNDIAIKMYLKSIEEDGLDDVIIITPRKKDCINSTMEINRIIQDKLISDNKPFLKKGNLKFKLGAKVIQRVNNYDKNIFNGEIGYIIDVFKANPTDEYNNMLTVQYPSKPITYSKNELDQIDLAYAMTVHLCLPRNTMLYSSNGIIELGHIDSKNYKTYGSYEIDKINIPDIYNGNYLEKPSYFIKNPISQCKKLTTVKGYNVTATLDHQFQVLTPTGNICFKKVSDIKTNDYVILSKGQNIYGDNINIPKHWTYGLNSNSNNNRVYKIPTIIDSIFSEFLGFMVADGTVFDKGIRLLKRHKDVVERFKYVCDTLFGTSGEIEKNKYEDAWQYEICSTYIVNFLRNIKGIQPHEKYVPDIILQTTKENQCAFLKSLFEDGTVSLKNNKFDHIELSFKDKKIINQVQLMLLNMGILSSSKTYKQSLTSKSKEEFRHMLYIYRKEAIKYCNIIGFISKFKNDRLELCYRKNINMSDKLTIPYIPKTIRYLIEKYNIKLDIGLYRNMIKTSVKNMITYNMANKLIQEINNSNIKMLDNDNKMLNQLNWLINNTYIDKVNNIIEEKHETYCLTMPETHQFVQNGFIGSNCQGSGYKTVIMIIDNSHYILLDSCLLYTAITRAKQRCLLLAEPSAFKKCIVNNKSIERQTWFKEF